MRIDVVTPSIGQDAGGVAAAVLDLYRNLCLDFKGLEVTLRSVRHSEPAADINQLPDNLLIQQHEITFSKKLSFSLPLIQEAFNSQASLIHTHGIWTAVSLYQLVAERKTGIPYIISPHGMLDPWIIRRGRVQKSIARIMYENASWRHSTCFHALTSHEADTILQVVPNAKIEVIPNGIRFPEGLQEKNNKDGKITLLFLGRLHEKKNVHSLVRAVNSISDKQYARSPFVLKIAGWGAETYVQEIFRLIQEGNKPERFELLGPIHGEDKERVLKGADIFILPSFSEGLPMAVLEAWSAGLMVMMSEHCNLGNSFSRGAAVRISTDYKDIAGKILECSRMPQSERNKICQVGYDFASTQYSWNVVTKQYAELYQKLVV